MHRGLGIDFCPCAKVMGWKEQQIGHSSVSAFQLSSNMFIEPWKLCMSNISAKLATQDFYICRYYLDFYLYLFFFKFSVALWVREPRVL